LAWPSVRREAKAAAIHEDHHHPIALPYCLSSCHRSNERKKTFQV